MSITSLIRAVIAGGAAQLKGTLPYLLLQNTGSTSAARVAQYVNNYLHLTQNVSWTGSVWNLDDVSKPGSIVVLDSLGGMSFYSLTAGANPRTPVQMLNVDVNGVVNTPSQLYASAYLNASVNIASASTWTTVPLDTRGTDPGNLFDITTNKGRFTVPNGGAGNWLFLGSINFNSSATGALRTGRLRKNNTTDLKWGGPGETPSASVQPLAAMSAVARGLIVGDFIEMQGFQDVGSPWVNGFQANAAGTILEAIKIG